jgi:hypothetical protein
MSASEIKILEKIATEMRTIDGVASVTVWEPTEDEREQFPRPQIMVNVYSMARGGNPSAVKIELSDPTIKEVSEGSWENGPCWAFELKDPAAVALGRKGGTVGGKASSPAKRRAARANGAKSGGRPSVKLYGFSVASRGDEAAWFHSRAAAARFAQACGLDLSIEETDTSRVERRDIMDTAKKPWTK